MSLATTDTSCEAAARILGAGSWTVFRRITLPIIQPGVIAGGVIAFIVSFDEAVISLFVAESGLPTLPVQVLRYVENSADAAVAALVGHPHPDLPRRRCCRRAGHGPAQSPALVARGQAPVITGAYPVTPITSLCGAAHGVDP